MFLQLLVVNTHRMDRARMEVVKRKGRDESVFIWVQGDCAQACHAHNTCSACSAPLPAESLHPLSSGKHIKEKARMLGLYDPDTIMAAASSGALLTARWLTGEVLQLVCNFDHFCSTLAVGVSRAAHGSQAKNSRQGSTQKDRETVPGEDGGAAGCCQKGVLACVSYFQEASRDIKHTS